MPPIILKKNLCNEILLKPAHKYNEIRIVSGFAIPSMASYHFSAMEQELVRDGVNIDAININASLIVGMTPVSKISEIHHQSNSFECSYVNIRGMPIHAKLYLCLYHGVPQKAFLTSANYTYAAFCGNQDEIASECAPEEALAYYKTVASNSVFCTHDEAEDLVQYGIDSHAAEQIMPHESFADESANTTMERNSVKLPLFAERRNKIHDVAGLDWGQRLGREPNQAYIPVPTSVAKSDFFPPLGVRFCVLTEDGFPFVCVMAQPKIK